MDVDLDHYPLPAFVLRELHAADRLALEIKRHGIEVPELIELSEGSMHAIERIVRAITHGRLHVSAARWYGRRVVSLQLQAEAA